MNPAPLLTYLHNQRLIGYHILVKFIWFSKWNCTKILFLSIRFISFLFMFVTIYAQITPDISVEVCKVMIPAQSWLITFLVFFSEVALTIRTWAMWNRNQVVGIGLLAFTLASIVVQCIFAKTFISSFEYAHSPYSEFRGCLLTRAIKSLWKNYVVLTVFEIIVFVLVAISAFRAYRYGSPQRLMYIIHRDGILFYIYLLCLTAINLVDTIVFPNELMTVLTPLQGCMYSVFVARIVLNIREECNRDASIELHIASGYEESLLFAGSLQLRHLGHLNHSTTSLDRPNDSHNGDAHFP